MAHFAELKLETDKFDSSKQNWVVQRVVVVGNDISTAAGPLGENDMHVDGETWCVNFFKGGTWKQTSYNNNFRKQYAGIGMIPVTFIFAYPYLILPNFYQFTIIIFIAITGTIAQTLLNVAFKKGELVVLLPLDFLKLVWSVIIGYTLFFESTPYTLWIGGFLIVASSSYIAFRERK